jgi:hypothetical protein
MGGIGGGIGVGIGGIGTGMGVPGEIRGRFASRRYPSGQAHGYGANAWATPDHMPSPVIGGGGGGFGSGTNGGMHERSMH